jgi:hypothetical protein
MSDNQAAASSSSQKRNHTGWPSPAQFHEILKQIAPSAADDDDDDESSSSMTFTEAAVMGLRSTFINYLDMVGSSLTEHDSLKEEELVVNALTINNNPQFEGFVRQAKEIITTTMKQKSATAPAKKRGKRKQKIKITPEMEAEQDRMLQKSKEAMNKKQKTENK